MLVGAVRAFAAGAEAKPAVAEAVARRREVGRDRRWMRNSKRAEAKLDEEHAKMPYEYYPYVYTVKIVLTTLAMLAVLPGYRAFPFRRQRHRVAGGRRRRRRLDGHLQAAPGAQDPHAARACDGLLEHGRPHRVQSARGDQRQPAMGLRIPGHPLLRAGVVVPIIEEFFLRGFSMRYVMDIDWHLIPFGMRQPAGPDRRARRSRC